MKMKKISKVKIALITLTAIVALVVVKALTAQFLYTDMGYSPVETGARPTASLVYVTGRRIMKTGGPWDCLGSRISMAFPRPD